VARSFAESHHKNRLATSLAGPPAGIHTGAPLVPTIVSSLLLQPSQLKQVPAGDYTMQLVVEDKLRHDKYRLTAQAMDFQDRNCAKGNAAGWLTTGAVPSSDISSSILAGDLTSSSFCAGTARNIDKS
jgi:hypothetical protein